MKITKSLFVTFLLSFLFYTNSFATIFTAVNHTDFKNPSTWDQASIPGPTDTVYIAGFHVTVLEKITVGAVFISNNSTTSVTSLNIMDTLTVVNDFNLTSENVNQHIDLIIASNAVLNVNGNLNCTRTSDNIADARLQIYMYGTSKAYILGDFKYDYKNSGNESSYEVFVNENALLDITGMTTLITSDGNNLDFQLKGSANVILRDSVELYLYGGEEISLNAGANSHCQILGNVYLYNSNTLGEKHVKLRVGLDNGGKMSITGDVNVDSDSTDAKIRIVSSSPNSEMNISGDISLKANSANDAVIALSNGTMNLGGNILRPNNYGALKMGTTAKLVFNGTEEQILPCSKLSGTGVDSLFFGKTYFENSSGNPIKLSGDFLISDSLFLSTSKIISSENSKLIIGDQAVITGGSDDAYIIGPVVKNGRTNENSFTFPIGDSTNYAPVQISRLANNTAVVEAQYLSDPPPFEIGFEMDTSIHNISSNGHWNVTQNADAGDLDITLGWDDTAALGITHVDSIAVVGLDGTVWRNYGNGGTTTSGTSGTVTSLLSDPPPFEIETFTIASISALNALPVELTKFQAVQQNKFVHMQWETASEINTLHFEVERSTDGAKFDRIKTISSKGKGESIQQYSCKDLSPNNGINYYRLKIIDRDGKFEHSHIEVVNFEEEPEVKIFPNPVGKNIQIEGTGTEDQTLEIFDKNGQKVYFGQINFENGLFHIDTETANVSQPGTYFLRITGRSGNKVIKFIKAP